MGAPSQGDPVPLASRCALLRYTETREPSEIDLYLGHPQRQTIRVRLFSTGRAYLVLLPNIHREFFLLSCACLRDWVGVIVDPHRTELQGPGQVQ